jgi:hypothetical protein
MDTIKFSDKKPSRIFTVFGLDPFINGKTIIKYGKTLEIEFIVPAR